MPDHDERVRTLFRRFLADQDFYGRCYARSLAEAKHHVRKRALPADSTKPPTNEAE